MERKAFVMLAGLACLLVSGGVPDGGGGGSAEDRAAGGLDVGGVTRALLERNPSLTPQVAERIGTAVFQCREDHGLDPELVTAVLLQESSARPWARSPKGAIGLMQVMPHMFEPLPIAGNIARIESNVGAGCRILADNIRRLGEEDGISAYFWGSRIRGGSYLQRVKSAREEVRRAARS